jgi:hypothetical protein
MYKGKIMASAGAVILLWILALPASADVVVKQKTSSSMMGGMMTMTGHSTVYISGDKQCTDTEMKSEMPMFSVPGMKSTSIVRLDKELTWNVDHEGKTYTEMTFKQMQTAMDSMSMPPQGMPGQESSVTDDVELGKPEYKIDRTGNKKKINNFNCEEVILQMVMRGKNKKTGDTGSFHLHNRMWVARECPGRQEYMDFSRKTMAKMGFGGGEDSPASAMSMMGFDAGALMDEMSKIDGLPIRQEMTMTISGDLQQQSEGEMAEQQEAMKQASEMMKGLGGLMGQPAKEAKKTESGGSSGAIFETTIEVESISTSTVEVGKFDVPKGYKKID